MIGKALNPFYRARQGAVAVEFGLIAIPLFALLLGIFEIGLIFLTQTSFERRLDLAARMIRTGQAHEANWSRADFSEFMCDGLFLSGDCDADLRFTVEELNNPASARNAARGALRQDSLFIPGDANSVILIRVELDYSPVISAGGISPMTGVEGQTYTFAAATAFRNEPF